MGVPVSDSSAAGGGSLGSPAKQGRDGAGQARGGGQGARPHGCEPAGRRPHGGSRPPLWVGADGVRRGTPAHRPGLD
eukprot:4478836-Pyramimonas_sp.AAC.1